MGDNIEYRVEQLEGKALDIGADVKLILTNHLPHIQVEIKGLSTQISGQTKAIAWGGGILGTIITALLIAGLIQ